MDALGNQSKQKTIDDFDNEPDIIIEDVETDYPYG